MWIDERAADDVVTRRAGDAGHQANMWTAMPGIIQSFNGSDCTVTARPALQGTIRSPSGKLTTVPMPLVQKCPVHFAGGGGLYMTHPIAQGDECLIVFASRCIDSWWQAGGVQPPLVLRMHDLSDGFCIPGFKSMPQAAAALPNISLTTWQIRTAGVVLLDLDPVAPLATFNIPVKINGNLTVIGTGTASVDFISNGKSGHNHVHGGVQTGSGNTGAPV
jgi:hypothetical protein